MKAKAMVMENFKEPLKVREIEIPKLSNNEVLVRVVAAGICGSDVHMWEGNDPRTPLPIILGHEGVGEVVSVKGNKTTVHGEQLKSGARILWNRGISCGQCYTCQVLHEPALCPNRWAYGIHRSCTESPFLLGCYADHVILDARADIFLLPQDIDPALMVPASCSGATTAHAFDMANLSVGDSVVVMGPGPLGLFGAAFAKTLGASQIIVIGGTEDRLNICKEFGATHIVNRMKTSLEERKEFILELTHGRGADVSYEAAGTPAAVKESVGLVRIGGTVLSAGFGDPNGTIELDCFAHICRKNLHLQGIWVSDTRHTYQAIELIKANTKLFSKLITHSYSLEEANKALEKMKEKEAIKAVLMP